MSQNWTFFPSFAFSALSDRNTVFVPLNEESVDQYAVQVVQTGVITEEKDKQQNNQQQTKNLKKKQQNQQKTKNHPLMDVLCQMAAYVPVNSRMKGLKLDPPARTTFDFKGVHFLTPFPTRFLCTGFQN